MRLDRLSWDETEQQLTLLLGGVPHRQLVDQVVRRSDGNPYLTELLVEGLDDHRRRTACRSAGRADRSPARCLASAVASRAREVMRLMAVAGRPTSIDDLSEVAAARGIGREALTSALAEATNAGISVAQGRDLCWFRHPLLAEVLYTTFVPGEAEPVHAAWAKTLESRPARGLDEVQRQGDLALHYEGARDLEACLEASLRAADLAKGIRSPREEAVHLRRAARLWPMIHRDGGAGGSEADLLERVARANDLLGDGEASFAAWSRTLELVDERHRPAARLPRAAALGRLGLGHRPNQGQAGRGGRACGRAEPGVSRQPRVRRRTGVSQLVSVVDERPGTCPGRTPKTRSWQPIDPDPLRHWPSPMRSVATGMSTANTPMPIPRRACVSRS